MGAKQTILVTGGAGFIGSHLAEKLLELGYKVVVFDNLHTGRIDNLKKCIDHPDFEFINGDVNSQHAVRRLLKFPLDYIYHYAARVGVRDTLKNRLEVLDDIEGIKNILNISREKKVKRLFYSSSSEVYGESIRFPQNENSTPINSRLPYAAVKNLGEIYIRTYNLEYGLEYTIFRFFNTYGPRQSLEFVVSKFITQAMSNRDISVYGGGDQTRSFFYISENIQATTNALTQKDAVNQTINVGNPTEVPIRELAKVIIKVTGSGSQIVHIDPLKEGDMSRRSPDITLMKDVLKVVPSISLEEGLKKTVAYFK